MKYFKLLIIALVMSLIAGCATVNGLYVNLDELSVTKQYEADIRGRRVPKLVKINENGEFKFKAPSKGKTLSLSIKESQTRDLIVSSSSIITDKTRNLIVLNNGIELWQKVIPVEQGENFNKIYNKALKDFKQLDKEQTKEITGIFVNLADKSNKSKQFCFWVHQITTGENKAINDKGEIRFKYPKNPKGRYKLVVGSNDTPADMNMPIVEKIIPDDAKHVVVLVDGHKSEMIFVKEGEDFDKKYKEALKNFKQEQNDHSAIYPGCEEYNVDDYSRCFTNKIRQHIARQFHTEVAKELNLPNDQAKIRVVFEVDEKGMVNVISVDAPHPQLKEETINVFKKLPVMKPAVENNKPVKTRYNLPVNVSIE